MTRESKIGRKRAEKRGEEKEEDTVSFTYKEFHSYVKRAETTSNKQLIAMVVHLRSKLTATAINKAR